MPTGEDTVTERVCLSTSITGCIKALNFTSEYTYLYELAEPVVLLKPNHRGHFVPKEDQYTGYDNYKNYVADADATREVWSLEKTKLKYVGKIKTISRTVNWDKSDWPVFNVKWKWANK